MFDAAVFVPGRFRLTNKMLSDLRAAGHYEGRAREMRRKPEPGHDRFANETQRVKWLSFNAWRRWRGAGAVKGDCFRLDVRYFVTGHRRHDPDAWYLLSKAAIDGMVEAMGIKDRFSVGEVGGLVAQALGEFYGPTMYEGDQSNGWHDYGVTGFHMRVWAP